MYYKNIFLLFTLFFIFNGCKGADPIADEDVKLLIKDPLADKTPPRFLTFDGTSQFENQTFVIQLKAQDETPLSLGDNPITFYITGGADAALFTLDENLGFLSFITPPDFENPTDSNQDQLYQVTLQAQDGSENEVLQNFVVKIKDVEENDHNDTTPPVFISDNNISIKENTQSTVLIRATDTNTITYSIEGGEDNVMFNINQGLGVIRFKVSPDFEDPADNNNDNIYHLVVGAKDSRGNKVTDTLQIHIINDSEDDNITQVRTIN